MSSIWFDDLVLYWFDDLVHVQVYGVFFSGFDLWRNCFVKNAALFEENSILPLPVRLEASGVESVWGEASQESPKNPKTKTVKIGESKAPGRPLEA